ncbi:carboxylesterase/lipase family protein [soil metagenome]
MLPLLTGPSSPRLDRRALIAGAGGLIVSACAKPIPAEGSNPVATTVAGKVRGDVQSGVNVFKGVRYGLSTAGARFLAPTKPQHWSDVKDALEYDNSSPQGPAGNGGGLYASWANPRPQSEDCLFLNVWTKGLGDGKKRPVMVWFHGGGFATGSGSSLAYDGVRLANRGDVVVVTVNHRLNAFGYTYLAEIGGPLFADSGNVGNLDMIQALEWVRDNIAAFGGDPGKVLIFGESGGGSKVSTLMAMPAAQGLFHRAVVQSGSTLAVQTKAEATENARKLLVACGLQSNDASGLQALPYDQIVAALSKPGLELRLGPVVDEKNLPRQPFTPDAPAGTKSVPMLIGTTKDEQAILSGARDKTLFDLTWETLPAKLAEGLKGRGLDIGKVIAAYRGYYPAMTPARVYFDAVTEAGMRRNAILQAERKDAAGGAPAFMYLLNWETPVDAGRWGSPHALDIAMMFDNVAKSSSFVGAGAAQAQKVADAMSDAWIRFARDGDPGWPAYTAATRTTMVFDVASQPVNDPRAGERVLFAKAGLA